MSNENINTEVPQVTLGEAKQIVAALAPTQSVLLLSSPGVGKSAIVDQAAAEAGLECRSLLGTQIAPEDVSGIPRIIGERSVFCPPRVLLPEDAKPFCLFLDELPACSPDIQKAFYSLLLERRVGEFPLPKGTWVVAAGNRAEDRSLVRSLSAALVNRVTILNVRVSAREWLKWARANGIRREIISYIVFTPQSLQRAVPATPSPFSTPRAWTLLSKALDRLEESGILTDAACKALAFGMLSPEDAAAFNLFLTYKLGELKPWYEYIKHPDLLPKRNDPSSLAARYFIFEVIRKTIAEVDQYVSPAEFLSPYSVNAAEVNRFLAALPKEDRIVLLLDQVENWGALGAADVLLTTFDEILDTVAA